MQCDVHTLQLLFILKVVKLKHDYTLNYLSITSSLHPFCPQSSNHIQVPSSPHASPKGSPPVCFPYLILSVCFIVGVGRLSRERRELAPVVFLIFAEILLSKLFHWSHQHWRLIHCVPILRIFVFSLGTMTGYRMKHSDSRIVGNNHWMIEPLWDILLAP